MPVRDGHLIAVVHGMCVVKAKEEALVGITLLLLRDIVCSCNSACEVFFYCKKLERSNSRRSFPRIEEGCMNESPEKPWGNRWNS